MRKKIKYLVMDVDGTLTDGKLYIGAAGEVCKAFHVKDGYGIHNIAIAEGVTPIIITGRTSEIVVRRCEEIGIKDLYQGISDKRGKLMEILAKEDLETVAYIGDDLNDISCMDLVMRAGGIVGCPADATPEVREMANFVSSQNGGDGAVREFIDWFMGEV